MKDKDIVTLRSEDGCIEVRCEREIALDMARATDVAAITLIGSSDGELVPFDSQRLVDFELRGAMEYRVRSVACTPRIAIRRMKDGREIQCVKDWLDNLIDLANSEDCGWRYQKAVGRAALILGGKAGGLEFWSLNALLKDTRRLVEVASRPTSAEQREDLELATERVRNELAQMDSNIERLKPPEKSEP